MIVVVNRKELELFTGAKVKNALLKYFTLKRINRDLIDSTEVYDAYGHVLDHDAPLSDGKRITFDESSL